jgi:Glycosyltransferase family 87
VTRTAVPSHGLPESLPEPDTPQTTVAIRAPGAFGSYVEGAVGAVALAGIVAGSVGIALAGAERPSFLAPPTLHGDAPWLAGPLAGLWPSLTRDIGYQRWDVTVALLAMTACWALAVACAPRVRLIGVGIAAGLSTVVLTLSPPFSLGDTFNYLHYGRMLPLHGLNPYTALPIQASADPTYRYSTWHHLPSPYGPLFTLLTEAVAPLSVPVAYWILKAVIGLCAAAVAVLTALLARALGRNPARAVAFVALNPLVLVYGIGGVHNDVLFMALLLAGALLAVKRRELPGGTAWAAAAAIKLSAGLALPILIAGSGRRLRAFAGVAAGGVVLGAITLLAFHGHIPDDATQAKLVAALSLPNLLGLAMGHGGLDAQLRQELEIVLALGTVALTAWTWRTRRWPPAVAWVMVLLVVTLGWAMPWYVLWVLPFAALSRSGAPRAAAIALTVFLLAIWAPATAPLLHRLGAHPSQTATGRVNNRFMHRLLR